MIMRKKNENFHDEKNDDESYEKKNDDDVKTKNTINIDFDVKNEK